MTKIADKNFLINHGLPQARLQQKEAHPEYKHLTVDCIRERRDWETITIVLYFCSQKYIQNP